MSPASRFILTLAALLHVLVLSARTDEEGQRDSLVRLLSAKSIELIEDNGISYRKVTGPARFLHNNTYLICDTALWNVNTDVIDALGNVKILQEETVLTSDKLTYFIYDDLAQFRGGLVQLEGKDGDVLRTRHLDYNTKDSVAIFSGGAAMRSADGQIIESIHGEYDSKISLFTFRKNVNMFTDSVFVRTSILKYNTDTGIADFGKGTDAWKDDAMLSSDSGWYNRVRELFFFTKNVHGMNPDKEVWADSLFFYRNTLDIEMLGNVQLDDTTRNVTALAGRAKYVDSLSLVEMTRRPAVIGIMEGENSVRDSVWISADTLRYRTLPKFQIDTVEFDNAKARLEALESDAITAYRRKAAEEAAKAAEEARQNNGDSPAGPGGNRGGVAAGRSTPPMSSRTPQQKDTVKKVAGTGHAAIADTARTVASVTPAALSDTVKSVAPGILAAVSDTVRSVSPGSHDAVADSVRTAASGSRTAAADTVAAMDSVSHAAAADTLAAATDSLAITGPVDSTKVGFLTALRDVRLFKNDFQMTCDSLKYNDLDSLVRIHKNPVVWNDGNRQYSADSIYVSFSGGHLNKAHLQSSAFIVVQEDSLCYDQIRSTEMLAYFGDGGSLSRFDALGDVSAVFYLKEDSTFATINKSQAKMLYAVLQNGNLDSVSYFDEAKNDAYPIAQIKKDDRVLKGFNWMPDKRPAGPEDITSYVKRPTERKEYSAHERARFVQTDVYFPGYMDGVYRQIAVNDSLKKVRAAEKKERERLEAAKADSAHVSRDSLALSDSLSAVRDSLQMSSDSLAVKKDSLSRADSTMAKVLSPEEQAALDKAAAKKAKEEARAAKIAEREAKWARLDSLDAIKDSLKAEKKAEKVRRRKMKILIAEQKRHEKELARLEAYKEKYMRRKKRQEARAAAKAAAIAARKSGTEIPESDSKPDTVD